jgi:t-SNARE complex subunit (syntaxin)
MKTLKKILTLLFEPLKAFANRNLAEKTSAFFYKNKWMIYVVSFIITMLVLVITYVLSISW